jgi:hypothetical protein
MLGSARLVRLCRACKRRTTSAASHLASALLAGILAGRLSEGAWWSARLRAG